MIKLMLFEYIKYCLTGKKENPYVRYLYNGIALLGCSILLAANYLYFIRLEKDIGIYTAYGTGAIFLAFIIRTLRYWYIKKTPNPALAAIEKAKDQILNAADEKINEAVSVKKLISYLPLIFKVVSIGASIFVSYYILKKSVSAKIPKLPN